MEHNQPAGQDKMMRGVHQVALALAVLSGVFLTTIFSISLGRGGSGLAILWIANGLPLAALLRTPARQWPLLVAAAYAGILAAVLMSRSSWIEAVVWPLTSCLQFVLTAYVLRRRFGSYFDLIRLDHVAWLIAAGGILTGLILMAAALIINLFPLGAFRLDLHTIASLYMTTFLGLYVMALPFLALSAQTSAPSPKFDRTAVIMLLLLIAVVALVFGPPAFLGAYIVMPILMAIAWRYGLFGAGIATLVTITLTSVYAYLGTGMAALLKNAGYGIAARGHYLELFYSMSMLISVPLAAVRTRLGLALASAETRAAELVKSEAAAVEARERLRRIIETSTDLICTVDAQGYFLEVSRNCETILGWTREEMLGRSCYDFLMPEDRSRTMQIYDQRKAGFPRNSTQNTYIRPDGTGVPMSWSASWIEEEQICHCVGRDMTEYRALEAQVYGVQRMEAIGQLTGGVAHDFNNLLTVVIGNSETLATDPDNPDRQHLAEMSLRAALKGSELTRQLLAFARRQPLVPCVFDANELLDASAAMIVRTLGEDLEFSIRKSEQLWRAYADPLQLETAILNLCINARDAMPHGGSIIVETDNATLADDFVLANPGAQAGKFVMIAVQDSGTGIAPEVMERIFEPFFTTKEVGKGSGLGLSMVYGFVKQSQGYVSVKSELGKGTTFRLYLPATNAVTTTVQDGSEGTASMRHGEENVLIVEDNDLVREHLQKQLESLGYKVTAADNAASALSVLEQHEDIDLLFTDVVMPGGMSGIELGERAARRWPRIRVLYTTGYAEEALTKDGRLIDGLSLLHKPYSKSELAQKVRSVLDEAP